MECELQSAASHVEQGHFDDTMAINPEVEFDAKPQHNLPEAPIFVEVCCGSALLSACASKMGFRILPIDFDGNKHRPFVHVVELDLRKKTTWDFLEHLVLTKRPFHFHAAPPCGPASRARDRYFCRSSRAPAT